MARIKVLLVEDDSDIREIIGVALSLDARMEVRSFVAAEEALAAVQAEGLDFDIALLDFNLPLMNGIHLHLHLRALGVVPRRATVLITAGLGEQDLEAYEAADIAGLIPKPFDPLTLAKEVRDLAQAREQPATGIAWLGRALRQLY